MALKHLSTREMVKHGADLLSTAPPAPGTISKRQALEAVPRAAMLIADLEEANAMVAAAQPPSNAAVRKLTALLGEKDARHDDIVRAFADRFASEIGVTKDPELRELLDEVLVAVLATGRSITNRSYTEQSGEGRMRANRVTEEHRKVMRKLVTIEGTTYEELYDELQQLAADIGALETQRADLLDAQRRQLKRREARLRWIEVINAIATMLRLARVDEEPILGAIRKAAAKAGARVVGDPDAQDELEAGDGETAEPTGELLDDSSDAPSDAPTDEAS